MLSETSSASASVDGFLGAVQDLLFRPLRNLHKTTMRLFERLANPGAASADSGAGSGGSSSHSPAATPERDRSAQFRANMRRRFEGLKARGGDLSHKPSPVAGTRPAAPLPPILCLPLELREQIWKEVLTRPEGAKPVHFHIYNKVYDSCTYDPRTAGPGPDRQQAVTTALLRTCHSIYDEAVQYLYDSAHFELVLLPGTARPSMIVPGGHPSGQVSRKNVEKRNCLGEISHCAELLRRVRRATVVLQPGAFPSVSPYRKRVEAFLQAIEYGEKLKELSIIFSVHWETDSPQHSWIPGITRALLPLAAQPHDPRREGAIKAATHFHDEEKVKSVDNALAPLRAAFGLASSKTFHTTESVNPCLHRGAWGHPLPTHDAGDLEIVCVIVAFVCLSAVTVPLAVLVERKRKRLKGQRWSRGWI